MEIIKLSGEVKYEKKEGIFDSYGVTIEDLNQEIMNFVLTTNLKEEVIASTDAINKFIKEGKYALLCSLAGHGFSNFLQQMNDHGEKKLKEEKLDK